MSQDIILIALRQRCQWIVGGRSQLANCVVGSRTLALSRQPPLSVLPDRDNQDRRARVRVQVDHLRMSDAS